MHHYVSLGNDALYKFPTKGHFLGFCKAREMADDRERDHIRPTMFGAEIVGRVWVMRDASQEDWKHMRMIAEAL